MASSSSQPQRTLRRFLVAVVVAAAAVAILPATAGAGAAFTTVDESVDGSGHCFNGNPGVNCNIYDAKQFVWLNGGPSANGLGPNGLYFFAVMVPGGQPDPNDGGVKNLSDNFDTYLNRTFTVSGGEATAYAGNVGETAHDSDIPFIRLAPYAETTNPGGVYIMAICSLANGYPVEPRNCKYDAFKVRESQVIDNGDLAVIKDATPKYTRTFGWTITKVPDKTKVSKLNGNATFHYTIGVTKDAGTDSGWKVTGSIEVLNPNTFDVSGVDLSDAITDPNSAGCAVTNGTNLTVPAESSLVRAYTCTYTSGGPSLTNDTNTATATWPDFGSPSTSADFSLDFGWGAPTTKVHNCVDVTDSSPGSLGSTCSSTTFAYDRTVAVPRFGCTNYDNTATFTAQDDSTYTGSASATVTVCRILPKTGAKTMGFWQNKNGQTIITTYGGTSCAALQSYLLGFNPFQQTMLVSATKCGGVSSTGVASGVAGYVYNVIKAANASGSSMNAMLRAQMLATALDVYFSDPSLGGNRITAPASIGGVLIDLTTVCSMIDSSSGTATCSGAFQDASSAFGGAASLTVSQMLGYASSQSNAGGSTWYANVKSMQELAKNAFDAINNQAAFAA